MQFRHTTKLKLVFPRVVTFPDLFNIYTADMPETSNTILAT